MNSRDRRRTSRRDLQDEYARKQLAEKARVLDQAVEDQREECARKQLAEEARVLDQAVEDRREQRTQKQLTEKVRMLEQLVADRRRISEAMKIVRMKAAELNQVLANHGKDVADEVEVCPEDFVIELDVIGDERRVYIEEEEVKLKEA
jgi:acetoin utilization deacetylase AcuC-like enzyme